MVYGKGWFQDWSSDVNKIVLKSTNNAFQWPVTISGVGRNCWNVTYTDKRVCALEGSSVKLTGIYSHPSDLSVGEVIWYDILSSKNYQDLRQETQFTNRVEYVQQDRNFSLKMNQLTKNDSGEYRLRFYTNKQGGFSGKPGVVLNVTGNVLHWTVSSSGLSVSM